MSAKSFLISDFKTGKEVDVEPFLLPEDAFPILEDAFVWRGRVRKKFGYNFFPPDGIVPNHLLSRLRVNLGNIDGAGALAGNVPGLAWVVGQQFSVGTNIFTVNTAGAAAFLTTGAATGTYNTGTGAYTIVGAAAATAVFFYPAQPVMGLIQRELANINFEQTIAFDQQFSYHRVAGGWARLDAATLWAGSDSQLFWGCNYRGANPYDRALFVVNFNTADHIKFLPLGAAAWTDLTPQLNTGGANRWLRTCRVLVPFKGRLVALNTIENDGADRTFPSRCRYSIAAGNPTAAATAWIDDNPGAGGFTDAPTAEQIISAAFVKDRLIVFFERSTWELVYNYNPVTPFVWQKVNMELGCESTFSQVPFDDGVIGIGQRGIHVANASGVERIDEKIPNEIYKLHDTNEGPQRTYGTRDYRREFAMWAFPHFEGDPTFPNRLMVYNYKNNSFAVFKDSFTCFGYYYRETGITWATLPYESWADWVAPWNAGLEQQAAPMIVGGNQEGFTLLFEGTTSNDASLIVTDFVGALITAVNHNLEVGQYIYITGVTGATLADQVYQVIPPIAANTFTIDGTAVGVYTGGGIIETLAKIRIKTKDFSLFKDSGSQIKINDIYFYTEKTTSGEFYLDLYINRGAAPLETLIGDNTVRTRAETDDSFALTQALIWHRVNRQAIASSLQMELTLSDTQMRDRGIQGADFILNAIMINAEPSGRINR